MEGLNYRFDTAVWRICKLEDRYEELFLECSREKYRNGEYEMVRNIG